MIRLRTVSSSGRGTRWTTSLVVGPLISSRPSALTRQTGIVAPETLMALACVHISRTNRAATAVRTIEPRTSRRAGIDPVGRMVESVLASNRTPLQTGRPKRAALIPFSTNLSRVVLVNVMPKTWRSIAHPCSNWSPDSPGSLATKKTEVGSFEVELIASRRLAHMTRGIDQVARTGLWWPAVLIQYSHPRAAPLVLVRPIPSQAGQGRPLKQNQVLGLPEGSRSKADRRGLMKIRPPLLRAIELGLVAKISAVISGCQPISHHRGLKPKRISQRIDLGESRVPEVRILIRSLC